MLPPRISIITPCLDRAQFIREAIESVLEQKYPNLEHIIVDGGSTDGTLEILREYPHLHVISERDEGMYDAINKGLHLAQGEIVGLLNSDDRYAPDSLHLVAESFSQHPEAQAVVGGALVFSSREDQRQTIEIRPWIEAEELWYRVIQGSPVTNAWFFRSSVFKRVGDFNSRYRYAADREMLIRIILSGIKPIPIRQIIYQYRQHSGSATLSAEDSRLPGRGRKRMEVLLESLAVYQSFLEQKPYHQQAACYLKQAHSEYAYRLSATALYHRQFVQAAKAAWAGWRYNSWWPFLFFRLGLKRLFREVNPNRWSRPHE